MFGDLSPYAEIVLTFKYTIREVKAMDESKYKPKWGARHDAVVARYEARKKDGTARTMIIGIRDE